MVHRSRIAITYTYLTFNAKRTCAHPLYYSINLHHFPQKKMYLLFAANISSHRRRSFKNNYCTFDLLTSASITSARNLVISANTLFPQPELLFYAKPAAINLQQPLLTSQDLYGLFNISEQFSRPWFSAGEI